MGLAGSRFLSKNERKRPFLSSTKFIAHRATKVFVSGFKRWIVQDAVFTILFGTNKINNTFYQPRRNKSRNSHSVNCFGIIESQNRKAG